MNVRGWVHECQSVRAACMCTRTYEREGKVSVMWAYMDESEGVHG